jgi:transposase
MSTEPILLTSASPSLFQQQQQTTTIEKFACRLVLLIALLLHVIVIQQERIKSLTKEVEEMEERLLRYDNSNTPPSRNSVLYRKRKKERREERRKNNSNGSNVLLISRRPGRKVGHKGVTQVFEPTERVVHSAKSCPKCNSKNLSVTKTEKVRKVDVPDSQPYIVTENIIPHYDCVDCGERNIIPESAKDILSQEGMLGKNILATIAMLYSLARLPYRKIPRVLESLYDLSISAATVWSSLKRISEKLAPMEKEVEEKINSSAAANFDETSISVNGVKRWIWVAVTSLYALIIVEKSRGADVLKKHFSEFKGVAGVDGWKSYYVFFARIQRCWAHILREIETLSLRKKYKNEVATAEEAKQLYSELKSLYDRINLELKDRPPPNQELHDRALAELERIISKQYNDPDVRKFATKKLKNAGKNMLTYTLYSGAEPTNNRAERALREPVVQRKIRGQLKTDQGGVVFGRMMTALATWTIQGLNPFEEFKRLL